MNYVIISFTFTVYVSGTCPCSSTFGKEYVITYPSVQVCVLEPSGLPSDLKRTYKGERVTLFFDSVVDSHSLSFLP